MSVVLMLILGYLLGSLSFSIIFTKIFAKTDVREHGSGNAGFTNTIRTAGKKVGILVFICDALKAVAAILIAMAVAKWLPFDAYVQYGKFAAALGAVLGHNFPLYYGFRGGKGIVVSIAIIYSLNWITGCFTLGAFLVVFAITGIVSLSSLTGAATVMITTLVMYLNGWAGVEVVQLVLMLVMGVLAFYMHRANIKRLLNGTESSFKKKKK
ncbi:MAG: glycerol-3-phosphate 1-O-acyltransferase PlsY [Clostridia bacterium]|nr:glycerol-3-phosphate 1-O-acyltransferase PlsY [Clostridia bacterium]